MMRYVGLFFVLLSLDVHAVVLPDGRFSPAQHQHTEITRLIVKPSNSVITATADGATKQARQASFAQQAVRNATGMEMQVLRHLATGSVLLELPNAVSQQWAEEYARWIAQQPGVAYAEPDRRVWPALVPDDTFYSTHQGHLQAPANGSAGAANLPAAWDITTGSSDIVVAVIDTGALDHVDLQSRFVGGSVAASGRDFISDVIMSRDGDGRDSNPTDEGDWVLANGCGNNVPERNINSSWHGLHVAGTIGAASNNDLHVAGIDWQAKLLTARVLGRCGGSTSDIADAMIWSAGDTVDGVANSNPARVLNLSLGGNSACSNTEQNAIDTAITQGAVVVVAAGNENDDVANYSPASCDNVITVAAVDSSNGTRASFSNYGEEVEIAAPGVLIASLSNSGTTTAIPEDGNLENLVGDISYLNDGTSMATPHVSGVISLMLAANQAAGGDLMAEARKPETSARITAKLQASARAFPTGTGNDCTTSTCGAGMLDAHQAIIAVSTAPTVNAGDDQSILEGTSVTLSATNTDDAYNTITTWQWTQTAGSMVTLNNANSATASFTAPATNETLTFSVTATDDTGLTGTDQIDVQVATIDTSPDAFRFTDQTDVALSTTITSNTITVSGINSAASISVTDGQYSINGGSYTSTSGTVNNGDTVQVQHTSSANFLTDVHTVLTIGGVSDTFTSTTSSTISSSCASSINVNQSISGNWESHCFSVNRPNSYAKYFTFTLTNTQEVTIDLQSSEDAYLFLLNGTGQNGTVIALDDDGGIGFNAKIVRTLSAGTYTTEATTFSGGVVGSFTILATIEIEDEDTGNNNSGGNKSSSGGGGSIGLGSLLCLYLIAGMLYIRRRLH